MKQEILFQRIEGLAVFALALFSYNQTGYSWWYFVVLLFTIDLSMLGYLKDKKLGAYGYNLGHSYVIPAFLAMVGWGSDIEWLLPFAMIWFAHIGYDRALGYGLKLQKGFTHTHMGRIGKKS